MRAFAKIFASFLLLTLFAAPSFAQKEPKLKKEKTKKEKSDKSTNLGIYGTPTSTGTLELKEAKKLYKIDTKKYLKDWSATVHFGGTTPFTDVRSYDWTRQTKKPSEIQWGAGIGLTKMLGSAFGLNLDYTLGQLQGRTVERGGFAEERQYWKQLGFDQPVYFRTSIFHQATLNFYINWMGLSFGYNKFIRSQIKQKPIKERRFAVYNKIGIGMIRTESNLYNTADDQPINGNRYLRGFTNKFTEVVYPISLGMKFKVTRKFDLGLEGTFTFTNSDKLDAMNFQTSIDKYGTVVNSLSKINRDGYAYVNINMTYKFGRIKSQDEHVEWVNPFEMMMAYTDEQIQANKPDLTDEDGDGVLNILDQEANTPEGYPVDPKGVTLDSDKDGCPDATDAEPFSNPLLPIADCKNVQKDIAEEVIAKIPPGIDKDTVAAMIQKYDGWQITSIYYDLDKAVINSKSAADLQKLGLLMNKYPDMKVNVVGHTDTRASAQYNQILSEKRVNNAIDYLFRNFGIVKDRFIPVPKGMTDSVVPNATKENEHQLNRRVDFFPILKY